MNGFFDTENKQHTSSDNPAVVYWHSSEDMHEVGNGAAKLVIGASVYLGKGAPWAEYERLYARVYDEEVRRILRPDGCFVVLQTDAYEGGGVTPRNAWQVSEMVRCGWRLVDTRIWERRRSGFHQPPFSHVWIWSLDPRATRTQLNKHPGYFRGVWRYPQGQKGNNSYPEGLCRLLVEAFTKPQDLIVDPFAGTARLLGVAARMGRLAVGYEVNVELKSIVDANLRVGT